MRERINRIKAMLDMAEGISDYRINTVRTESTELFFVHKSLETVRSTDTSDIKVTVFVSHDGRLGDATFSVYASYGDEKIKDEIAAARKKAALIDNESYEIPSNETASFESDSNLADYKPSVLAAEIADAVFAADAYEGGSINALEVFIYRDTVNVTNSRGIDKTELKYRAMVEAIPTWNGEEESVELYECHNFTEFYAEAITAEIDSKMRQVRDRLIARVPKEKLTARVILAAPELATLTEELAFELNYGKIYNNSNAFSVGDAIQKNPTGDTLTVKMCEKMKGSVSSRAFDADGFTLRDTEIIKDGDAVGSFGDVRYASYLKQEPTGALSCIQVSLGSMSEAELKREPYLRCASMSGLQVDIYNDYIGGEVRLAYYFNGECEIPVTGISISGKLSDALSCLRLSDTETTYEAYSGPDFACLSGIEIV